MRIALAQLNPTVGQIERNAEKIGEAIDRAAQQAAELVVFPELSLLGYPPKDLLLKEDLIERCDAALEQVAGHCRDTAALVGTVRHNAGRGLPLFNAVALCESGRVVAEATKLLLPTYDVFDERRYFQPAESASVIDFHNVRLGLSICEDLWNDEAMFERRLYDLEPAVDLAGRGAQILINCSASPFVVDKHKFRRELFSHTARRHGLPLVYCNQIGGNDELLFDG
ncbi:MAG: nitrilase-related carbon-nitrogen hydrolase, partial [Phycisphaeraceae bacterium]|nr:nitrilase-related carbon-nitrogen hydrolase [Phycisphaeraceae bacterium]